MNKIYLISALLLNTLFLSAQSTYFVKADATGADNGQSWQNAFTDLQSALSEAEYGDIVRVAQGTYKPTSDNNREAYFELKNGVKIMGGYAGSGTNPDARDFYQNETILSGDIGIENDSTDNSYTVVYSDGTDENTLLDGFTIVEGNADETAFEFANLHQRNGGGIYLTALSNDIKCIISHCKIKDNYAANGGGIYVFDADANSVLPHLLADSLLNNNASNNGGGIFWWGNSEISEDVSVADSLHFTQNRGQYGSGISLNGKDNDNRFLFQNSVFENEETAVYLSSNITIDFRGTFTDCAFLYNEKAIDFLGYAPDEFILSNCFFDHNGQGAVQLDFFSQQLSDVEKNVTVENCLFDWNSVDVINNFNFPNGGAVSFEDVGEEIQLKVSGSTFRYNSADMSGGAIYAGSPLISIDVENSFFLGNTANDGTGGGIHAQSNDVSVRNTIFQANIAKTGGGIRMINGEVLNCVFLANNVLQQGGGIRCNLPTIANCIFKDNINFGLGPDIFCNSFPLQVHNSLFSAADCEAINYANSNISCDTGTIFDADPLFTDVDAVDFSIAFNSPARNAGDNSFWQNIPDPTDYFGNERIQGSSIDIGIYETPPLGAVLTPNSLDCSDQNVQTGSFDFSVINAALPLSVLVDNTEYTFATLEGSIENLPAGTFSVIITDAEGSLSDQEIIIEAADAPEVSTEQTMPTCAEFTNGILVLNVAGETAPFSILWEDGSEDFGRFGLSGGAYAYTLTDNLGCSYPATAVLEAPDPISLNPELQNPLCNTDNSGQIELAPTGSNGGFTFNWSPAPNGQTGASLSGLSAGLYTVTVSDSQGCGIVEQFTLTNDLAIEIAAELTPVSCGEAENGSISISPQNGTPDFSYNWSNNAASAEITNLAQGDYTVTVTDGNGCTAIQSFTIIEGSPLALPAEVTDATCDYTNDGSITVDTENADNLTFAWSGNADGQSGSSITDLAPGLYFLTVTDEEDCPSFAEYTVEAPAPLTLESSTATSCFGGNTGQINLTVSGGTPSGGDCSYAFLSSPALPDANCGVFENVSAGIYSLTVIDANSCSQTSEVQVISEEPLNYEGTSTNASCADSSDGAVEVNIQASENTTFAWSENAGGQDEASISDLAAGTYFVTISGEGGCQGFGEYTVAAPSEITADISLTAPSCVGNTDGTISLSASGGTPLSEPCAYIYSIEPEVPQNDCGQFSAVPSGTYTLSISDANECTVSYELTVAEASALEAEIIVNDVTCPGFNDGFAAFNITGGTPPYAFSETPENLPAGEYQITVSDANNCSLETSFFINEPEGLDFNFDIINASSSSSTDGSILIENLTGGTGSYTFLWENGETSMNLTGITAGTYTLLITDENNCTYSFGFDVDFETNTQAVDFQGFDFTLVPNVLHQDKNMDLILKTPSSFEADLGIYNAVGQKLQARSLSIAEGESRLPLVVESLSTGLYFILLQTKQGNSVTRRFLIQ